MSSQGVMSSKETNNNPGLCPIKSNRAIVARLGPEINSRVRYSTVNTLLIFSQAEWYCI